MSVVERVREFVETELIPLEASFLSRPFRELLPALREKRSKVKAAGLWMPFFAREYGGLGLGLSHYGRISEELGRTPLGHYTFNCQAPDVGNMEVLHAHGTPAQKRDWLEPLARGDIRSCFAMTEPEYAGSNPTWMNTSAVKDGSDYVINGHKWFTSAADGAAFAIVMAVTNPDARPHERASQIIAPANAAGFQIVRNIQVMGDAGSDWHSHAEVRFENCRVPQSNLLGQEGRGFAIAQERLGPGRIHHCMRWIGISERALDLLCRNAAARQLAPGQPLALKQTVQTWIAECRAEINASRLLVLDTARKIEELGASAAREDISLIKFYVAGVLQRVLDRAIQAHGARGVSDDLLLSYWYRHERAARIYDGPDEVHKAVVARRILRKYGVEITV